MKVCDFMSYKKYPNLLIITQWLIIIPGVQNLASLNILLRKTVGCNRYICWLSLIFSEAIAPHHLQIELFKYWGLLQSREAFTVKRSGGCEQMFAVVEIKLKPWIWWSDCPLESVHFPFTIQFNSMNIYFHKG